MSPNFRTMKRLLLVRLTMAFSLLLPMHSMAVTPKKVLIITNRGCEEICKSFQQNLQSQGEASFIVRDIAGDTKKVPSIISEARSLKVDLIATWGTGVTLAVVGKHDETDPARHVTDIPVVYLYVGNPVQSKIAVETKRSGRANIAGANTSVPVEAQVNLIKSYRDVSRVGMLFNTDEPAAVAQAAAARKQFESAQIAVDVVELPKDQDGKPHPESIARAIDELATKKVSFIYHIGSSFMLANASLLSEAATARGLPIFTSLEATYRKGDVLLGLISPLGGIGQIGAYQAGQILFGNRKPGELDTPTLSRHSVLINMKTARQLKAYPPMKLLQFAEITN